MAIALMGPSSGGSKIKELDKYKRTLLWSDLTNNEQTSHDMYWSSAKNYQIYYVKTKYYHTTPNSDAYGQYIFSGHWTMLVGRDTGTGNMGNFTTCKWACVLPGHMMVSYGGSMYQWKIGDTTDDGNSHCKVIEIYGLEGTEI